VASVANINKSRTALQSADQLQVRGKIRLSKAKHPTFEGHVTLNEDEYKKYPG